MVLGYKFVYPGCRPGSGAGGKTATDRRKPNPGGGTVNFRPDTNICSMLYVESKSVVEGQ